MTPRSSQVSLLSSQVLVTEKLITLSCHILILTVTNSTQLNEIIILSSSGILLLHSQTYILNHLLLLKGQIHWFGSRPGMAYWLNLADNRLPIFDQSRLPITDILSVLSFTDTDNRYFRNCRYIYSSEPQLLQHGIRFSLAIAPGASIRQNTVGGKSPRYDRYLELIFGQSR